MSNLYVYLIRSRNKDNKDIPNFKERAKTILEYKENEDKIIEAFKSFATKGVPGEQTRLYRSVNSRNEEKIREELIIRLLRDKPSMTQLNRTLASVAQQVQNRDESKKRGFFEPTITYLDGTPDYISNYSVKTISSDYKQIGIQKFSTEDILRNKIAALEKENKELKEKVDNLTHLVMKEQRKEVTK